MPIFGGEKNIEMVLEKLYFIIKLHLNQKYTATSSNFPQFGKIYNFTVIQILCENNMENLEVLKLPIFASLVALNFVNMVKFSP